MKGYLFALVVLLFATSAQAADKVWGVRLSGSGGSLKWSAWHRGAKHGTYATRKQAENVCKLLNKVAERRKKAAHKH